MSEDRFSYNNIRDRRIQIEALTLIQKKARISPLLRQAVNEAKAALEEGDVSLASELTSVKSLITGSLHQAARSGYPFAEDRDHNERALGGYSVYGLLDSIHHRLAISQGETPAGMMVFSADGVRTRGPSALDHPIVRRIQEERDRIRRMADERARGSRDEELSRDDAYDAQLNDQMGKDEAWYLAQGFPPDYAREFALYNTHGASVKPRPLTEHERGSMNVILQRYDSSMNVRREDLPPETAADVDDLERTGAVRIVNGRIIPSFILEEHNAADRGRYEGSGNG